MAWVSSAHHVLGIPHLLSQLRHAEGSVLLTASRCERCEADHEEVQPWEGNQIDCQLPQISIQLTCKALEASLAIRKEKVSISLFKAP